MDFDQAERRFKELQARRQKGDLDADMFRVEVAKLLLRDEQGAFWMIDADDGTWYCNRGEGWVPCDPHSARPLEAGRIAERKTVRRRLVRVLALGALAVVLLVAAGVLILLRWLSEIENPVPLLSNDVVRVNVVIAAPPDGGEVVLGQEVAIESTIAATPNLQTIDRVLLQVNGVIVDTQNVQPKIQPGQVSLPLSQLWRPVDVGEYRVEVTALSVENVSLGTASITVYVAETSDEALPEPACVPDAAFVADVTIPVGTAFPPQAPMEKVWQVRNSGTCAWGGGYELVLTKGSALGSPGVVPVLPTVAGERVDLAVTFQAPAEPGRYESVWQLRSPSGDLFGPTLTLSIEIEELAEESSPPERPVHLQAVVIDDGRAIRLTWEEQSDNEDAFRVYRGDVEASIGLAPANAELFVDEQVTCGSIYHYTVVAFNASGASAPSETGDVSMPPCAPPDTPPSLILTVVPTQVVTSETFTVTFEASDDIAVQMVVVWGVETGHAELDTGRIFSCTEILCTGSWPVTWTVEITTALTIMGVARDSVGQESEPVSAAVAILPLE